MIIFRLKQLDVDNIKLRQKTNQKSTSKEIVVKFRKK